MLRRFVELLETLKFAGNFKLSKGLLMQNIYTVVNKCIFVENTIFVFVWQGFLSGSLDLH
jgi:hypothetical protein